MAVKKWKFRKKERKRLLNVNVLLKACFVNGNAGVEKMRCFLCTMHRKKRPERRGEAWAQTRKFNATR